MARYIPQPDRLIEPLLYWAKERESIRKKKEAGDAPPWTQDPILQTYRFCNVRRRDDRVSRWLIENFYCHDDNFEDLLVRLKWVALCRWVNWPPTISAIHLHGNADQITWDSINLPKIGELIDDICGSGTKAWTGAYMIRAPSPRKNPGMTKGRFVAEVVVGQGLDSVKDELLAAIGSNRLEPTWRAFCKAPNWGSFMAGQVVADLTYTPLLESAEDLYTWAPIGPGSKRGFNRLMGLPLAHPVKDHEGWCQLLRLWREKLIQRLGPEYVDLTLHDIQNCLCEVDKYLRVKKGEGRPRAKYKPEIAF